MAPDETILLQLAAQLEVAAPWSGRRPAGWVGPV
jgi:amidase